MNTSCFGSSKPWILTAGDRRVEIHGGRLGLRDPRIAAQLAACRAWDCGCGGGVLTTRRVDRGPEPGQTRWFTVVASTRHGLGCPANLRGEEEIYSEHMFDLIAHTGSQGVVCDEVGGSASRVLGFEDLASAAISRAAVNAFVTANSGLPRSTWTLPTEENILETVGAVLSTANFSRHDNAFDAARAHGYEFLWGITNRKLAHAFDRGLLQPGGVCYFRLDEHWSGSGRHNGPMKVTIPAGVGLSHAGKITIFGETISPPYFVLLAVDGRGEAHRIYIQPVERRCGTFSVVESRFEGKWWSQEVEQGRTVLKVQRLIDLELLPDQMFSGMEGRRLVMPHRADFVRWTESEIHIIETAGLGTVEYLADLSHKEINYRTMVEGHCGVRYIRVTRNGDMWVECA